MRINTNVSALRAGSNLAAVENDVSKSMAKLSKSVMRVGVPLTVLTRSSIRSRNSPATFPPLLTMRMCSPAAA